MTEPDGFDERLVDTVIRSFENIPIRARLEYVKNILVANGGDRGSMPAEPAIVIAAEIVGETIKLLDEHPRAIRFWKRMPSP